MLNFLHQQVVSAFPLSMWLFLAGLLSQAAAQQQLYDQYLGWILYCEQQ